MFGLVKEGCFADVILVDGNPVEDIWKCLERSTPVGRAAQQQQRQPHHLNSF
jgi:imidazolonepropionase-like amidohydrolase